MDALWLVLPLAAVYAASGLLGCDLRGAAGGAAVVPRPPPWVFGAVWPVLLLLFGLCAPPTRWAWALLACLAAWTPLKCAGRHAAARVVLTASLVLAAAVARAGCTPVWPMVAWLAYASLI